MSASMTVCRRCVVQLAGLLLLPAALAAQQGRPPTLDDLLALEELGTIAMSPDGRDVAIVVRRARAAGESYQRDRLGRHTRADVWLASMEGGAARNLTLGIEDRSGFWNPVWSPDGRYLAMLSTRGVDNVRPWVWDRETGELRSLGDRGVETRSSVRLSEGWPHQPMTWTDSQTLLVHLLAEGEVPWDFSSWLGATEIARRSWPLAARGTGGTSSVLESGVGNTGRSRARGDVVLLDVTSGRTTSLAEGILWHVLPSPDRRQVALVLHSGWDPHRQGEAIRPYLARMRTRLGLVDLRGERLRTRWIDDLAEPAIDVGSLRYAWSPDGAYLAVPVETDEIRVVETSSGRHATLPGGVTSVAWSGAGWLLYRMQEDDRGGWHSVDPSDALRGQPGRALPPSTDGVDAWWTVAGSAAAALVDGRLVLWSHTAPDELRGVEAGAARAIVWPDADVERGRPVPELAVALSSDGDRRYGLVTLGTGEPRVREFTGPSSRASLRGFHAASGGAVFRESDAGVYTVHVGRSVPTTGYREVLGLNSHMETVGVPERRLVRYRDDDGNELLADLLLPYGYEEGRRYPLVVRVYGGARIGGARDPADGIASPFLNHHLLAARGYAVLEPSAPLGADPMLDIVDGILPAVDHVIEMGIADPERMALLGQSYGGYSVYSLITQTDRFAAAIGLAGMTNLTSLYGSIYFSMRYNDWGYQWTEFANSLEYGLIGLGVPPWENPDRYVKNSPVFSADQIDTPLLILHGDLDHVPVGQADELFTALYRLGKRARYVRYWGETHVIQSPPNIRDMWTQIFGWLEENLR